MIVDSNRTSEREFKRTAAAWPSFLSDSLLASWKAWQKLPENEQADAARCAATYVADCRGRNASICSFGVYLSEKRWQGLPARESEGEAAQPLYVNAFSKVWTAVWLARCLAGPGRIIQVPTRFIQSIIDAGGERGERERLQHQARHGYRDVHLMADAATRGVGLTLRLEERAIEPHAESFVPVNAKSDLATEWRDAFERRGWPSLPDPGKHEWLYFPAGGPESGLAAFELAVRGENDAGRSEAAE